MEGIKKGCDISYYQKDVDFMRMSLAGLETVTIRIAYGKKPDANFLHNWKNSRGHLLRSFYQYFLAGEPLNDQYNTIKNLLSGDYGEMFSWLDLEWREKTDGIANKPGSNYLIKTTTFLSMLDDLTGMRTAIYTGYPHFTTYLPRPRVGTVEYQLWNGLAERPLIIAQYAANPALNVTSPTIPMPWFEQSGHQFSSKGNYAAQYYGCEGNDLDLIVWEDNVIVDTPLPPPIPPNPDKMWTVIVSKLNVRKDHDSNSQDVGDLYYGDKVRELDRYTATDELWILHDGGWSAAQYFGNVYMQETT